MPWQIRELPSRRGNLFYTNKENFEAGIQGPHEEERRDHAQLIREYFAWLHTRANAVPQPVLNPSAGSNGAVVAPQSTTPLTTTAPNNSSNEDVGMTNITQEAAGELTSPRSPPDDSYIGSEDEEEEVEEDDDDDFYDDDDTNADGSTPAHVEEVSGIVSPRSPPDDSYIGDDDNDEDEDQDDDSDWLGSAAI